MKEVIRIQKNEVQDENPVEFTHYLNGEYGWGKDNGPISLYDKIVYLGKCNVDGDMFACYSESHTTINIYKGHLNSGKY